MLAKNQTLTLECAALGADFEGICRHEGQVVFVRGALPGEQVRAKIIKTTRSYAVARLEALLTRAPDRAEPPCPYYPRCGGCTAQHLSYAATLAHKRAQVRDCLERIGGIAGPCVGETMGMASPWRYRNKGAFPVGCRADGRSDGRASAVSPRAAMISSTRRRAVCCKARRAMRWSARSVNGWRNAGCPPTKRRAMPAWCAM